MSDLGRQTLSGLGKFIAALALFLFAPAWTLHFWQAWLYLLVFTASTGLITLYVWKRDRENTFTAGTVEVALDQNVISTGPYAWVRHPMYAGALVMLLGTPLALGSWWAC